MKRGVQGKCWTLYVTCTKKQSVELNARVFVGGEIASKYGVLQGDVKSKLFNEILTDLKDYLEMKCGLSIYDAILVYILYANDLILFSKSAEGVEKLIDDLFEFCKKKNGIL